MESNEIKIQTAKFVELVGIHSAQTSYSEFDLVLDQGVNLEYYCLTLLNKTFDLPQPKLNLFINHQLSIVQDKIKCLSSESAFINLLCVKHLICLTLTGPNSARFFEII